MSRRYSLLLTLLLGLGSAAGLRAQEAPPLNPYQTPPNHSNTLRIWGDRHMDDLARAWALAYRGQHPEIKFDVHLIGNGTAMPALYLGLADVVLMGRDPIVTDNDGFAHVKKYVPLKVEFGTGSVASSGHSPALVLLVNQDNPLRHLTLGQVDAIFSSLRLRGGSVALLTWGQLGLTGEWADKAITLYGPDTQSPSGYFFERVALGDSRRMNWDHYREFEDVIRSDGSVLEASAEAGASVGTDRYGLAVSSLAAPAPHTVALALGEDNHAYLPTVEAIAARRYPLARPLIAFADQPPGRPLDPKVKAFLAFILGKEGQAVLEATQNYLPLPPDLAMNQLKRLD